MLFHGNTAELLDFRQQKKKNTAIKAAMWRENWPNRVVNNFGQKSSALMAAGCHEIKLRKVGIFKAIRHSYKTVVEKNPLHSR